MNNAGVSVLLSERTEHLLAARTLADRSQIRVKSPNEIAETSLAGFDAFFDVWVVAALRKGYY